MVSVTQVFLIRQDYTKVNKSWLEFELTNRENWETGFETGVKTCTVVVSEIEKTKRLRGEGSHSLFEDITITYKDRVEIGVYRGRG